MSKRQVSLQLVAVIDGKMIPIKTADYTESIAATIADGQCEDTEAAIVDYLTDDFYEGNSAI